MTVVTIDGVVVECSPDTLLADAFALVSGGRNLARPGCGIGNCVACIALVNGVEVKACLALVRDRSIVVGPEPNR